MSSPEAWQWHRVEAMVAATRARIAPLLGPIGKGGVGSDLEASGEYVELRARFDGTSRHSGPDHWLPIVDTAAQLLIKRSKDLRLARIWTLASARVAGPEALLEGIVLHEELGARFPNGLHPWSDFDRARSFTELVDGACWDVLGLREEGNLEQLLAIGVALDALAARFGHVFKAPEPGFTRLEAALRTARARIVPPQSGRDQVGDFLRESRRPAAAMQTKIEAGLPETLHAVLRFPDAFELASRPMRRLAPYRMQLLLRPRPDSVGLLSAPIAVSDVLAARASAVHFMVEADGGLVHEAGATPAVMHRSAPIPFSPGWETRPIDLQVVATATDFLAIRVGIWSGDTRLARGETRMAVAI